MPRFVAKRRIATTHQRRCEGDPDRIVPGPRAPTESHHGSTERNAGCSGSGSPDFPAALSSPARTRRLRWADLLRRVFAVDVLTCPHCGGARRLIAMITDGPVVRRILGPPRAAQHSPGDRPRKSAARARVRLVVRDASELSISKEARCGGAVPRAASPPHPSGSTRLPSLPAAPKRGSEGPDPLVRGLETSRESARSATLCRGSSAWSSYPLRSPTRRRTLSPP